jgi:hypothetical protein
MPRFRRLTLVAGLAVTLAPLPAAAESQSSDSSSNCSNGRCSRVDRLVIEDRHGRRGWVQEQRWRESDRPGPRHGGWGYGWGLPQRLPGWPAPRRAPDDHDDDDD